MEESAVDLSRTQVAANLQRRTNTLRRQTRPSARAATLKAVRTTVDREITVERIVRPDVFIKIDVHDVDDMSRRTDAFELETEGFIKSRNTVVQRLVADHDAPSQPARPPPTSSFELHLLEVTEQRNEALKAKAAAAAAAESASPATRTSKQITADKTSSMPKKRFGYSHLLRHIDEEERVRTAAWDTKEDADVLEKRILTDLSRKRASDEVVLPADPNRRRAMIRGMTRLPAFKDVVIRNDDEVMEKFSQELVRELRADAPLDATAARELSAAPTSFSINHSSRPQESRLEFHSTEAKQFPIYEIAFAERELLRTRLGATVYQGIESSAAMEKSLSESRSMRTSHTRADKMSPIGNRTSVLVPTAGDALSGGSSESPGSPPPAAQTLERARSSKSVLSSARNRSSSDLPHDPHLSQSQPVVSSSPEEGASPSASVAAGASLRERRTRSSMANLFMSGTRHSYQSSPDMQERLKTGEANIKGARSGTAPKQDGRPRTPSAVIISSVEADAQAQEDRELMDAMGSLSPFKRIRHRQASASPGYATIYARPDSAQSSRASPPRGGDGSPALRAPRADLAARSPSLQDDPRGLSPASPSGAQLSPARAGSRKRSPSLAPPSPHGTPQSPTPSMEGTWNDTPIKVLEVSASFLPHQKGAGMRSHTSPDPSPYRHGRAHSALGDTMDGRPRSTLWDRATAVAPFWSNEVRTAPLRRADLPTEEVAAKELLIDKTDLMLANAVSLDEFGGRYVEAALGRQPRERHFKHVTQEIMVTKSRQAFDAVNERANRTLESTLAARQSNRVDTVSSPAYYTEAVSHSTRAGKAVSQYSRTRTSPGHKLPSVWRRAKDDVHLRREHLETRLDFYRKLCEYVYKRKTRVHPFILEMLEFVESILDDSGKPVDRDLVEAVAEMVEQRDAILRRNSKALKFLGFIIKAARVNVGDYHAFLVHRGLIVQQKEFQGKHEWLRNHGLHDSDDETKAKAK